MIKNILIILLINNVILCSQDFDDNLSISSIKDNQKPILNDYKGYWRFVRKDFETRHKHMISFFTNKALNTRLYLGDKFFRQYINPQKTYGGDRPIIKVSRINDGKDFKGWNFIRLENNIKVQFSLNLKNGLWYYQENEKEYQVIKGDKKSYQKWLNKND